MLLRYLSPSGSYRCENIIRKSRFIASIAPVADMEETDRFLLSIKKEFRDASHNCYACRIGTSSPLERSGDGGEPQGTAGHPILDVLKKRDLTNAVIVVTRYFGGIKLGTGGLCRAYAGSAAQAASQASIAAYTPHIRASLSLPYDFLGACMKYLESTDIMITERNFSDHVRMTLAIPSDGYAALEKALTDLSAARARLTAEKEIYIPLPVRKAAEGDLEHGTT